MLNYIVHIPITFDLQLFFVYFVICLGNEKEVLVYGIAANFIYEGEN